MNIINKLTIAHLKENKGRTIITLIGIMISVALITAVITGGASYLRFYENAVINETGKWHFQLQGYTEEELESIKNDSRVAMVGLEEQGNVGEDGVRIKNGKSIRTSTGYINRRDSTSFLQNVFQDVSGTYPKTPGEIMVRAAFIEKNGLDWKVGDTITLPTGCRIKDFGMIKFPVTGGYQYGEIFEDETEKEFKLVGIINDDCSDFFVGDMFSYLAHGGNMAYVTLKKVTPFSMITIRNITSKYGYRVNDNNIKSSKKIYLNDALLAAHLCGDEQSEMITLILPMLLIILLIIMIASTALIYNAFGMSLAERVRYLGMLTSVGATRRQKKMSVYFEGLILGAIGIPTGLVLGLGISSLLVGVAGNITDYLPYTQFEATAITLVVPFWSIAAVIIISVLTIFISSYRPAQKASAINAIDAIRTGGALNIKPKRLKSSRLIRKIFGYEGELANKNLKRNGRRGRLIIASIAISVVLFISVNYFCYIFAETRDYNSDLPYQIEVMLSDSKHYDEVMAQLEQIDGVKDHFSVECDYFSFDSDFPIQDTYTLEEMENLDDLELVQGNQEITHHNNVTPKYKDLWKDIGMKIFFIEDKDFNQLCEANGIDWNDYYTKVNHIYNDLNIVILNNVQYEEGEDDVFNENIIGEWLNYCDYAPVEESWDEEREDYTLYKRAVIDDYVKEENEIGFYKITGMVNYDEDNYIFHLAEKRTISCYAPMSMAREFSVERLSDEENNTQYEVGVVCDNHREVAEKIDEIFDNADYDTEGAYVMDVEYYAEQSRAIVFVLKTFLYSFLVLITLITLANIVNSISTSLMLRKKEFAMLKSVGVTPKGFQKMIVFECLLYGLKALAFGLPLSVGISVVINRIVGDGALPYSPNILLFVIVIIAVFALVGVTMLYGMSKSKKESIVDTLKEDII